MHGTVAVLYFSSDQLRRKVRLLQAVVRRREKKIRTLSEALDHCKKENMLSDEAHDSLTDTFSPVTNELILNEVKSFVHLPTQ